MPTDFRTECLLHVFVSAVYAYSPENSGLQVFDYQSIRRQYEIYRLESVHFQIYLATIVWSLRLKVVEYIQLLHHSSE